MAVFVVYSGITPLAYFANRTDAVQLACEVDDGTIVEFVDE